MGIVQNPAGEWSVLSFDTDRIKKYIFATSKLKEIRGASALLDSLNRELPQIIEEDGQGWEDGPVVYSAGGSCTAIVPHTKADKIISQVENLYPTRTVTASITGVSFQADKKLIKKHFGQIIKELGRMLQEKKAASKYCGAAGIPGYVKLCESCSMHPAEILDKTDEAWLCQSCKIKREAGEGRRRDFWEQFCECDTQEKYKWLSRISTLDQMSAANNYLGFISCDGNNMGKVIESLKKPRDFSLFASGIDDLIKEVTFKAVAELVKPVRIEDSALMPFEVFLMGGDDLVMAVPAQVALEVTSFICREFEKGSKRVLKDRGTSFTSLSLGAGVVIGPVKYPFYYHNRLAEQLQKSAKRKCAVTGISKGVIDYQVVSGSGFAELEDIRGRQLTYVGADEATVRLTMRPYFNSDLEKILAHRNSLQREQFPKSRLGKLYSQLFINRQESTLGTAMAISRCKPRQSEALRAFLKDFDAYALMPWSTEKDGSYCTPLGDLMEIYDV